MKSDIPPKLLKMGSKNLAPSLAIASNSNIEKSVFLDDLTVATAIPSDKRKLGKNVSNLKLNCCQWYLLIKKIIADM